MTLFSTDGVRHRDSEDEFHITTFFRVRFAKGVSLLSTSEFLLWSYSNKTFRTKAFFIGITFGGSIWTRGILFHRLFCYSLYWCSRTALVVVFLYGGNIPFVVSLCFASQRTPTACPCCAGSISTIGLAPFCFKSAGLALIWASAVLLWFLALLYRKMHSLSIRRVHNKSDILLHQKSKFLGYMNFVFPVHCSTSPGKGSAPQIVQGHRRHCSGILNRYHRRACSYINLICPLYNPWIIMSISPHPKARKWYRWLRISKEIVQIA